MLLPGSFSIHWGFLPVTNITEVFTKWWFFYFHYSFYISWNSVRKRYSFSLFPQLLISVWTYKYSFCGCPPLLSFIVHTIWPLQTPSHWLLCPLTYPNCFSGHFLIFWYHRMFQTYLHFFHSPGICHISKELWFFLWMNNI